MSKRTIFTTVTPLPPGITRDAVMQTLSSHTEMIDLNPLVEERHPVKAPAKAAPEELGCTWYSLTDKISYLPGGLMTGKVQYYACFHDLPSGLQTHVYAPMGLDIKGKWTLGGTLPGEPAQAQELGMGMPKQGLWLREDVEMRCNVVMTSFVKKNLKKSHATLVDRLVSKAHTMEATADNTRIRQHENNPSQRLDSLNSSSSFSPAPSATQRTNDWVKEQQSTGNHSPMIAPGSSPMASQQHPQFTQYDRVSQSSNYGYPAYQKFTQSTSQGQGSDGHMSYGTPYQPHSYRSSSQTAVPSSTDSHLTSLSHHTNYASPVNPSMPQTRNFAAELSGVDQMLLDPQQPPLFQRDINARPPLHMDGQNPPVFEMGDGRTPDDDVRRNTLEDNLHPAPLKTRSSPSAGSGYQPPAGKAYEMAG